MDTDYNFQLVLRTTAGTFASEKLEVKTHKMTDLSGITVTPGILPAQLKESLTKAVERIGAKIADTVRIDTTHFVTTEGRGLGWEKAVEMNIPVVRPEWVEGCERGGRIVGVRQYYLDADPRQRMATMGSSAGPQQSQADPRKPSKEETPLPALPTDQASPTVNGQAAEKTQEEANKKSEDEEKKQEDEDKHSDDRDVDMEQKSQSPEEQKARIEDREQQKVAIRQKSPQRKDESGLDVTKSPITDVSEEDATTPGAASFQDVAL